MYNQLRFVYLVIIKEGDPLDGSLGRSVRRITWAIVDTKNPVEVLSRLQEPRVLVQT